MCQLMLGKTVQEIGLVLCFVGSLAQQIPAGIRILPDLSVMTGGDMAAAQIQRSFQHGAEFQMPVAFDTGIGGQSGFVAGDEISDDLTMEIVLKIKYMEGNAHSVRNSLCIPYVIFGIGAIQFHSAANTGISLLLKHMGSNAAVHTAAHSNKNRIVIHSNLSFDSSISGAVRKVNSGRNGNVCNY
jgi:hypothetical protein